MIKFADLPIHIKIVSIVLVGMLSATFVTLANFIMFDLRSIKSSMHEELLILSRITAARSGAAVAFNDVRKATENLQQLSIRESILTACIYGVNGNVFAEYVRPAAEKNGCFNSLEQYRTALDDRIVIIEPLANKSRNLGWIVVASDLSPVRDKIKQWVLLSAFTFFISTIVLVLMTRRLQGSIVSPLRHLTQVMDTVRDHNDLALRAVPRGKDELGQLVEAFNEMLGIIENSHTDLEIVYNELVYKSTKAEATAVELEAHSERVKETLSGAVHDLRQPLQAMAIFADMLGLQGVDEPQKKLLEKLQLAMDNLRTMFNEILDISKLEHKAGTAEVQTIALQPLFDKLSCEFEAIAKNKGLTLRTRVSDISLTTIPGILERVIRNLVSNALNYTDNGGVLLAARKRHDGYTIEVWDTGRGIPEKKQTRIFHKFEQEDAGKEKGGGYGLGLAIVRQFVEIMGYRLQVLSIEGVGSCFRIIIPLREHSESQLNVVELSAQENPVRERVEQHYMGIKSIQLETTIILVDDDNETRQALVQALQLSGFNVVDFESFNDIQAYFSSHDFIDPDLIISDYQLAVGVTGDMAIAEIRESVGIDVPAFIITGTESSVIQQEIINKGYRFLAKPVSIALLLRTIKEYLD